MLNFHSEPLIAIKSQPHKEIWYQATCLTYANDARLHIILILRRREVRRRKRGDASEKNKAGEKEHPSMRRRADEGKGRFTGERASERYGGCDADKAQKTVVSTPCAAAISHPIERATECASGVSACLLLSRDLGWQRR